MQNMITGWNKNL